MLRSALAGLILALAALAAPAQDTQPTLAELQGLLASGLKAVEPSRRKACRETARLPVTVACASVSPKLRWASSRTERAAPPCAAENSSLDAPLFYQLLIGEMELSAGRAGSAYEVMLDAARRTRDETLFKRAVIYTWSGGPEGPETLGILFISCSTACLSGSTWTPAFVRTDGTSPPCCSSKASIRCSTSIC